MPSRPSAAAIAALATIPVAYAAANGVTAGGATLIGAGLAGLAGLTIISERWRRRVARARATGSHAESEVPEGSTRRAIH